MPVGGLEPQTASWRAASSTIWPLFNQHVQFPYWCQHMLKASDAALTASSILPLPTQLWTPSGCVNKAPHLLLHAFTLVSPPGDIILQPRLLKSTTLLLYALNRDSFLGDRGSGLLLLMPPLTKLIWLLTAISCQILGGKLLRDVT